MTDNELKLARELLEKDIRPEALGMFKSILDWYQHPERCKNVNVREEIFGTPTAMNLIDTLRRVYTTWGVLLCEKNPYRDILKVVPNPLAKSVPAGKVYMKTPIYAIVPHFLRAIEWRNIKDSVNRNPETIELEQFLADLSGAIQGRLDQLLRAHEMVTIIYVRNGNVYGLYTPADIPRPLDDELIKLAAKHSIHLVATAFNNYAETRSNVKYDHHIFGAPAIFVQRNPGLWAPVHARVLN